MEMLCDIILLPIAAVVMMHKDGAVRTHCDKSFARRTGLPCYPSNVLSEATVLGSMVG